MKTNANRFSTEQMKYLEKGITANIDTPLNEVQTPEEYRPHFSKIHNLCMLGRFEEINSILRGIDAKKASPLVLMGMSRLTWVYKDSISEWNNHTRKAYDELKARGEDADSIMRGVAHFIMTDEEIINEYETTKNDYYITQYLMAKLNLTNSNANIMIDDFITSVKGDKFL